MLVVMESSATPEQIQAVVDRIESVGMQAKPIPGGIRTSICVLFNQGPVNSDIFSGLPGVRETIAVSKPYKLVSRETHPSDTIIDVSGVPVGGAEFVMMAGPCAVESYEQLLETAQAVKQAGAQMLRAGAFKPRTSPYAFQGLGEEGLKILARVRDEVGLPFVTEAVDHDVCKLVDEYADMIQIGARNMQNYSLLKQAGRSSKPILLKRGLCSTTEEWLMAAEYIMLEGNRQVVLCERGVRTFADHLRNTLDLSVVPYIRRLSHLPIMVDPSHGAGNRDLVPELAYGAAGVGANGLLIEVHCCPEKAWSDGAQSLSTPQFAELAPKIRQVVGFLKQDRH